MHGSRFAHKNEYMEAAYLRHLLPVIRVRRLETVGRRSLKTTMSWPPKCRYNDVNADPHFMETCGMLQERFSRSIPNSSASLNMRFWTSRSQTGIVKGPTYKRRGHRTRFSVPCESMILVALGRIRRPSRSWREDSKGGSFLVNTGRERGGKRGT